VICFLVTNFTGVWPTGTAAVVYADGREQAKHLLMDELHERGIGGQQPDNWTIEPLTPCPSTPTARVVLDGDY
jgi:hypothetical protein